MSLAIFGRPGSPDAHEEDQSPIQTGQSLEVPVRQVPVPRVGGDDVHRRRGAPMRHRYPGAGRGGESLGLFICKWSFSF